MILSKLTLDHLYSSQQSVRLSKHGVKPPRDARHLSRGTKFDSVEHIVEIVNIMDTFFFEDLVKQFYLSVRRVFIGGN